jgi:hypothetical protein
MTHVRLVVKPVRLALKLVRLVVTCTRQPVTSPGEMQMTGVGLEEARALVMHARRRLR